MTNGDRLWIDPSFGASGDMLLGALLGLGAPLDAVRGDVSTLGVSGWTIDVESVLRAGIGASRALVVTAEEPHPHRAWSTIDAMLAAAPLPDPVRDGARRTFECLGRVEAGIHQIELDAVHFHEVGAVDAIVDIVGVWSALHHLGPTEVVVGPIGLGHGHVGAAHGRLPTPAPATADILRGVPVHSVDVAMETVTPTGAALLTTIADRWGPIPSGRLGPVARGAGGRNPDSHPNVVSAILIEQAATSRPPGADGDADPDGSETISATVLATNLDDTTPELIGHTIDRLLAAGADDAWVVPILMKKGRPGHELRVLCGADLLHELRQILFVETGTLGIRAESVAKTMLPRAVRHVTVRGQTIAIKSGPHHEKPEYDDLRAAAQALGLPMRQLALEALQIDS